MIEMNKFVIALLTCLCAFLAACSGQTASVGAQTSSTNSETKLKSLTDKIKTPVLVELFTSEGCSSCPPADRLLAKLEAEQPFADIEVITLALHVDYWNDLGWKDEFSSAMFTRRQDIYSQALKFGQSYTPQMVVDGRTAFVGSKEDEARRAITSNSKNEKAKLSIVNEQDVLKVEIDGIPRHENLTVYLAVTEDGIATDVRAGENSGRKLNHAAVVRELRSIGSIPPDQDRFSYEQAVQIPSGWKKDNLNFVIFLQENQSRKVLGAGRIKAF